MSVTSGQIDEHSGTHPEAPGDHAHEPKRGILRCQRCQSVLIQGACATHGAPGTPTPTPATSTPTPNAAHPPAYAARRIGPGAAEETAPRVPWPSIVAIVAVVLLAGATAMVWQSNQQLRREQRVATADLEKLAGNLRTRLDDQSKFDAALGKRIKTLEGKLGNKVDTGVVAAKVQPSVWTIEAGNSQGSGFFLGDGGKSSVLITNHHVVADVWASGGREVSVRHKDGQEFTGKIDRVDERLDLALIRAPFERPALQRAPDLPEVGASVVVVGSPLGLEGTVSDGIVSNLQIDGGDTLIQFTAPISPGSSGGPVVDGEGRVLGVAFAGVVDTEGLYFAIPTHDICTGLAYCK